jgi:tetratricopeptide (TPR) repeat protein
MPQDLFEMLQKANMLFRMGNHRDALELLTHAEPLAKEKQRSDALADIYGTIGTILSRLGNFEKAKKYLEQALKISEQLALIDPSYELLVATTQNKFGTLLHDMGRRDDAKIRFEQALKMRKALLSKDPENAQYQSK